MKVKKEKKGVTDHEFHRMEQWLTLVTSDKARENDRRKHREQMEMLRQIGERRAQRLAAESSENREEPKRNGDT